MSKSIPPTPLALIGARGHVGAELIRLVAAHPALELACVGSRELDGQAVADVMPGYRGSLRFEALDPEAVARRTMGVVVLALPNGKAAPWVEAIECEAPDTLIVDLSADYRFDERWYYGLPELTRKGYAGQRRISNPGCYATAMQLAIAPMLDVLTGPPQCFGVSGYSGAGTTPSPKNDPELLRDNLMPYSLSGHLHQREVTRHLGHPVEFFPHVAAFFRGISMTVNMHVAGVLERDEVCERYRRWYADEPLVAVQDEAPWVSRIAGSHGAALGGFELADEGRRLVLVSVLDNLLKGAATQALQNINLALGLPETTGMSL
ncbi:MAG TPA: N-acetyl-gamma-glutamyl-phosphate reductase [Xanthomonadaceae bacterium]|nr:N-acetyl-gamma-glutamyl-phosphate reductase [Xanthomonadaceae bacterium]